MSAQLRVLIVEDSENDALLLVNELERGGYKPSYLRVDSSAALIDALRQPWDSIVSDQSMPRFSAKRALELLKARNIEVPFIVVSGTIGEESAARAMKAGASDYVLKGNLHRLVPAVARELREAEGHAARRRAEQNVGVRARQQAAVAELGQRALAGDSITDLLDDAATTVAATLEADNTEVLDVLPGGLFVIRAETGLMNPRHPGGSPAADPWCAFAIAEPAPVATADVGSEDRFDTSALKARGTSSGAAAIIRGAQGPTGVLSVSCNTRRTFTQDDLHFLQSVANILGSAGERERHEQALRESEGQFRQAQKMEAVGRLAGGIAHDFNNLLTAILGYSDFVLAGLQTGDPVRADVEEIRKAGERAAALTRQLLAFGRRQVLEVRVLDVAAVALGMSHLLQRLLGDDVELVMAGPRPRGRVKADPGQIEQVIMNLAVNARDAMPWGGRLVIETTDVHVEEDYAHAHAGMRPGDYVMLAVTDTGVGMDEATQTRIFEPFFTTKTADKGTGLGLSTVYGIVQQSGGWIWVYSEVGQGTTFKVFLPRSDDLDATVTPPSPRTASGMGSGTILLVEDQPHVRDPVRRTLERDGFNVLEAGGGGEALTIAARFDQPIRLMITDLVMPGLGGRALAEVVQAQRPGVRVLYLSGYADHAVMLNGVLAPGMAFLQKPFSPGALLCKVREVLGTDES